MLLATRKAWRRIAIVLLPLGLLTFVFWFWLTQPVFAAGPAESSARAEAKRLESHVRKLSEDFYPRHYLHEENQRKCADFLYKAFEDSGGRAYRQPYEVRGRQLENILVDFGPAEGARVYVGAHYDSHDETPGADDNASGVAGLLELARLLGQSQVTQPVTVVAYSTEEPPNFRTEQMGSAVHARSLQEGGNIPRAVVILEMIGYFTDEPNSQRYPIPALSAIYPSQGDFIAVIGRLDQPAIVREVKRAMLSVEGLKVESINAPASLPGVDFSDHLNYWAFDWPAVMVTDTAFMRNTAYHTDEDTWDRLDYRQMALVVDGVLAYLLGLKAEAD